MALDTLKRPLYPVLVGAMLGLLQTGLYFQLTSTLSSGFGTYLMVTLCWLIGSAISVSLGGQFSIRSEFLLLLALLSYGCCGLLLSQMPFETQLWPLYAALVVIIGLYPGLFFARMASTYRARSLFLLENNGFIIGLVAGTILLMLGGRMTLWVTPVTVALAILLLREPLPEPRPAAS
jgi:hypothetical protein